MKIDLYYREYECGGFCNVSGICSGHKSEEPIGIIIDGLPLVLEDVCYGDKVRKEDIEALKRIKENFPVEYDLK
jgi:hypothetical protein